MSSAGASGVVAGLQVVGGLLAREQGSRNAIALRRTAAYNAAVQQQSALYNQNALELSAEYTAFQTRAVGKFNAQQIQNVAAVNVGIRSALASFNSENFYKEALIVWEQSELDIGQFEDRANQAIGQAVANIGASGVVLDRDGDTASNVVLDMKSEAQMDVATMKYNTDITAGRLMDAGALTKWEGEADVARMMFQAESQSALINAQSEVAAKAATTQAKIDGRRILWDSKHQANRILLDGHWKASQSKQAGNKALFDSLVQAGNTAVQGGAFG